MLEHAFVCYCFEIYLLKAQELDDLPTVKLYFLAFSSHPQSIFSLDADVKYGIHSIIKAVNDERFIKKHDPTTLAHPTGGTVAAITEWELRADTSDELRALAALLAARGFVCRAGGQLIIFLAANEDIMTNHVIMSSPGASILTPVALTPFSRRPAVCTPPACSISRRRRRPVGSRRAASSSERVAVDRAR